MLSDELRHAAFHVVLGKVQLPETAPVNPQNPP